MQYSIKNDDVLEWARNYDGPQFHAILCDPPYHLTIEERFGKPNSAPAKDGVYGRSSKGFMGKTWDGGDLAFKPETWALLAQHLLPGGFGMAFAGSRGWHRLAVAIEDAGLIIHPSIFGWGFGSGFPKATRIDSQIDKAATVDCPDCENGCNRCNGSGKVSAYDVREVVGVVDVHYDNAKRKNEKKISHAFDKGRPNALKTLTTITTPLAQAFAGHRYGRQALKPALEPIIVFQKPYSGRAVDSITETGAGALNIDGGRIGTNGEVLQTSNTTVGKYGVNGIYNESITVSKPSQQHTNGRWPANLTLTHSPDCVKHATTKLVDVTEEQKTPWTYEEFFENYDNIPDDFTDEQVRELYKATPKFWRKAVKVGEREEVTERWQCTDQCPVRRLGEQSGVSKASSQQGGGSGGIWSGVSNVPVSPSFGDQGTAARYFFNADWSLDVAEQLATADPVRYQAKASRAERDAGLEGFEAKQFSHDGRNKPIENAYQRNNSISHNPHPTVKPIKLIEHLATLLLPPERYAPNRRLLVPFSGSGSEMIGAILAGWDYIQGIDLTSEYVEIAHARIKYWSVGQAKSIDNEAPKPKTPTIKPCGQITLF